MLWTKQCTPKSGITKKFQLSPGGEHRPDGSWGGRQKRTFRNLDGWQDVCWWTHTGDMEMGKSAFVRAPDNGDMICMQAAAASLRGLGAAFITAGGSVRYNKVWRRQSRRKVICIPSSVIDRLRVQSRVPLLLKRDDLRMCTRHQKCCFALRISLEMSVYVWACVCVCVVFVHVWERIRFMLGWHLERKCTTFFTL